ncbi:SPOSA6832_03727 [Sporobolomyces salmonicolor]|uniref:Ribose-5-phosphate isomerase n=1 Tax=Sporidiobolus salmonicolor TaxID=5005 RepID=A0A0D6EPV6_SPOSA|nr:SPOSA6832_03727 [Sporobolomyces salmonicolor]
MTTPLEPMSSMQPSTTRRPSHSNTARPDPLSSITHASASRIGPGVIPTGLRVVPHGDLTDEEKAKRLAAYAAVDEHVKEHHKVLGIGSGSTVPYVVERLCQPPHSSGNFDRWFIPTGFQSKELIVKAGLNLGDVDQFPSIDVTIDGADEVDDELNAIKGGGACQLREKVLAEAATHFIIVADSRKDTKILGTNWKQGVPIEVAPFAWAKVFQNSGNPLYFRIVLWPTRTILSSDLQKMGCEKPTLRMGKMKAGPVVTDNGNFVIDAVFSESYMRDPSELLQRIKMLTGVLEVGIFAGMAEAAYFGYPDGTVSVRWQDGRCSTVDKEKAQKGLAVANKGVRV